MSRPIIIISDTGKRLGFCADRTMTKLNRHERDAPKAADCFWLAGSETYTPTGGSAPAYAGVV